MEKILTRRGLLKSAGIGLTASMFQKNIARASDASEIIKYAKDPNVRETRDFLNDAVRSFP